jgi:hypothetical protein
MYYVRKHPNLSKNLQQRGEELRILFGISGLNVRIIFVMSRKPSWTSGGPNLIAKRVLLHYGHISRKYD